MGGTTLDLNKSLKSANSEVVRPIKEVSKETGLSKVVGADYWPVLPINTLIPGVNGLQILRFDKPNFILGPITLGLLGLVGLPL